MTKKTKRNIGHIIATLALASLAICAVRASDPTSETIPFTQRTGNGGGGCPGAYTGYSKMTNSAGSIWITPPTNTTSGTFTNASGFPPPYLSVTCVVRKSDSITWCATNSVTFPATNTAQYSLTIYVKNTPPPPTNGQPMNLQVIWQ